MQLASAASELAGLSRGGVGGLLQRTLGIDTVGIGGTSGNALVLGQQLGRNLYVSIEQNLSGTGRQVVLEYRFKKGFSLRSATGETGSGATTDTGANIGLSWRKDY